MDGDEADVVDVEATDVDSPEAGADKTVDYEKQYRDTQAWGTQQSQKAAQLEQELTALRTDPEAQRKLLTELGYELPDEDDELDPDEISALKKELGSLKEQFEQSSTAAQEAAETARIDREIEQQFVALEEERGEKLSKQERKAIFGNALTLEFENGVPPISASYEEFEELWTGRQKKWAGTKKPTHRVSANGRAAEQKPDISTTQGKIDLISQRLEDARAPS